jgi:OOP family OmpA-OmpF porin
MQSLFNTSKHQASVAQALLYVPFFFCCTFFLTQQSFAQTKISCDPAFKQVMFVVDVSGSMETNDRLAEVKQFALRTVKERSKENLLFKLISFGGSCNDVQTDVDWTRDAAVINAGIKGLYVRGGTPLGSALEYTIDNVKKSAYPDQTQIFLLNDGANACGDIKTILQNRVQEIPCAKIYVVGIELQDDENNLTDRALSDAEAISAATGGRFLPLTDVRELQGVSSADTSLTVRSVAFEPRKKIAKEITKVTPKESTQQAANTTSRKDSSQTLAATTYPSQPTTTQASVQDSSRSSQNSQAQNSQAQNAQAQTTSENTAQTSATNKPSTQVSARQSEETPSQENRTQEKPVTEKTAKEKPEKEKPEKEKSESRLESPSVAHSSSAQDSPRPASNTSTNTGKTTSPKNSSKAAPKQASSLSDRESTPPEQPRNAIGNETNTKKKLPRKETPRNKTIRQETAPRLATTRQETPFATTQEEQTTSTQQSIEEGIIVFYLPNSTVLLPEMKQGLERLVERLRGKSIKNIVVEGHSSVEGSSAINLRLSVQRASSVAALLRKDLNLNDAQVRWNAFGEVRPVAPNETESGRQENRRVEVRVVR